MSRTLAAMPAAASVLVVARMGLDVRTRSPHHRRMSLRLCESCNRHVRDAQCPFCGATDSSPVPVPHSRATRAAMVFGAATMVTALACGGTTTDAPTPSNATPYGSPPRDAGEVFGEPRDASTDAELDGPGAILLPDGAVPPDGAAPDGAAVPPYGAPPPDGGR